MASADGVANADSADSAVFGGCAESVGVALGVVNEAGGAGGSRRGFAESNVAALFGLLCFLATEFFADVASVGVV